MTLLLMRTVYTHVLSLVARLKVTLYLDEISLIFTCALALKHASMRKNNVRNTRLTRVFSCLERKCTTWVCILQTTLVLENTTHVVHLRSRHEKPLVSLLLRILLFHFFAIFQLNFLNSLFILGITCIGTFF